MVKCPNNLFLVNYKIWLGLEVRFFSFSRIPYEKFFSICGNDSVSYAITRFVSREFGAVEPCVIKMLGHLFCFLSSLIKRTFSLNFLFLSWQNKQCCFTVILSNQLLNA